MGRRRAKRNTVELDMTDVAAVLEPYDYEGEPADSWLELVAAD
jgi:hypothetical protein